MPKLKMYNPKRPRLDSDSEEDAAMAGAAEQPAKKKPLNSVQTSLFKFGFTPIKKSTTGTQENSITPAKEVVNPRDSQKTTTPAKKDPSLISPHKDTPTKPRSPSPQPKTPTTTTTTRRDTLTESTSHFVKANTLPITTEAHTPTTSTAKAVDSFIYPFGGKNTPAKANTPSRPRDTPDKRDTLVPSTDDSDINHPHKTYKFLYPPHRRDINKRAPDDPDYDERTLHVPESFLDSQTPALRQWWLIKQRNMDSILFFKMGKFYELFNEDAVIAVNNLDIMYMKGDETKPAHAGFPEISYDKYANILIERGYKVVRIEQTETPAMMEERCQRTGRKGKFDKVVKREVCRVTTRGTLMSGVMESVFSSPTSQYLLAIREDVTESSDGTKSRVFGVCFVDVTISKLYMGQFNDDHNLSKLNILLAHHTPTEVVYERGNLNQEALLAIQKTGALLSPLKSEKEFWSIKRALSYLKVNKIFLNDRNEFEWPQFLKELFQDDGESAESIMSMECKYGYEYALNSFGAMVYYLQSQLIVRQVMNCLNFSLYYTPLERPPKDMSTVDVQMFMPPMIIDHIALKNLEIFQNTSGTGSSTLFDSINNTKTHFGQRLLRNWLCAPLCDIKQINNRLDAVEALVDNDNVGLMNEYTYVLEKTPDLERMLSKIKAQCFKSENDSRAIMFDDNQYSKAKIVAFTNLIQSFKRVQSFLKSISGSIKRCNSTVLRRLLSFTTDGGLYPDYSSTLEYFENAFDHESAKKSGQIIPKPGVDRDYDECQETIESLKRKLDDYLEEQRTVLRCRQIEYFGNAKNRYQIQVPEAYCKRVPDEYRIETTRKGFKRYYTPTIDKLFQTLTVREEDMKRILNNSMSTIFEQFSRKIKLWSAAIECLAILDVLQSIANFVRSLKANSVDVCRPIFVDSDKPIIEYKDARHPALVKSNYDFVPNDLVLDDRVILLSGANMGGKSTLMRQTALLVILAQVGCYVPASMLRLTPVDRIFSRLGASDRLLEGESTFYTELSETSAMLMYASKSSLLLLDELGRGTSTYDGTAIAYAVLREISDRLKCRCLFSTHYHSLVKDFEGDKSIRFAHMACKIETESDLETDPLRETITFLYKLADGPAGKSYGFNVAKLAGIQDEIIREAFEKAKELELIAA